MIDEGLDSMTNLFETFHGNFEVVEASTPSLLRRAQALRYQVYCLERGYEDKQRFSDGRECDAFDQHSVHSIIRCRGSGKDVGVVRLVLHNPDDSSSPFPMEKHGGPAIGDLIRASVAKTPRHALAEISRFSVSKDFKRRIAESGHSCGLSEIAQYEDKTVHDAAHRRLMPHITIGLFAGVVRMSAAQGITHWYSFMEPTLIRMLSRFGIYFEAIGPPVQFNGARQATVACVDEVLRGIYAKRPDVWEVITDHGRVWPLDARRQMALSG